MASSISQPPSTSSSSSSSSSKRTNILNIDELYVDNGRKIKSFSLSNENNKKNMIKNEELNILKSLHMNSYKVFDIFKTALLPIGYPNTVPPEYLNYQKWNIVQAMCSYFRTIMSTASVLEGFGVGNPGIY